MAASRLLPPLLLLVGPPATRIDVVYVRANPKSRPYVAYRTSPFDQDVGGGSVPLRIMEDGVETGGGVGVVGPPKKNEVNRRPRGVVGGVPGGEDPMLQEIEPSPLVLLPIPPRGIPLLCPSPRSGDISTCLRLEKGL